MTAIEEYASRWAETESRVLQKNAMTDDLYIREGRRQIFFAWAVDDKFGPVAQKINAGTPIEDVEQEFNNAYDNMLKILWKLQA